MAQTCDVVERFFAGKIGQIEPVLDEVNTQHTLQSNRRAAISSLRVVRFYYGTQINPWHDAVHSVQKFVASCWPAVLFKSRSLIRRHCQSLLFHSRVPPLFFMTSVTHDQWNWWT